MLKYNVYLLPELIDSSLFQCRTSRNLRGVTSLVSLGRKDVREVLRLKAGEELPEEESEEFREIFGGKDDGSTQSK